MSDGAWLKDDKGRFLTGNIGGGRKKGYRNKLGEAFIEALHDDFQKNGVAAIQQARLESPIQYVKVIASLLPSEHKISFGQQYEGMTDDELAERARQLAKELAPLLAGGTGNADEGAGSEEGARVTPRVH